MRQNASVLAGIARALDEQRLAIEELDLEALAAVSAELDRLLADLGSPDEADRALAERVQRALERNEGLAGERLHEIGHRLGQLRRGRSALRGYSPAGGMGRPARAVDREA